MKDKKFYAVRMMREIRDKLSKINTKDPVTGSAHCCLGPYWESRLKKSDFVAFQLSERGGVIKVKVKSNRVILSGQAVTVIKGELIYE